MLFDGDTTERCHYVKSIPSFSIKKKERKKKEEEKGEKCKHITEHPHEVNYLSYANKHMQIRSNSYMF